MEELRINYLALKNQEADRLRETLKHMKATKQRFVTDLQRYINKTIVKNHDDPLEYRIADQLRVGITYYDADIKKKENRLEQIMEEINNQNNELEVNVQIVEQYETIKEEPKKYPQFDNISYASLSGTAWVYDLCLQNYEYKDNVCLTRDKTTDELLDEIFKYEEQNMDKKIIKNGTYFVVGGWTKKLIANNNN
jgi:hypothetical protein